MIDKIKEIANIKDKLNDLSYNQKEELFTKLLEDIYIEDGWVDFYIFRDCKASILLESYDGSYGNIYNIQFHKLSDCTYEDCEFENVEDFIGFIEEELKYADWTIIETIDDLVSLLEEDEEIRQRFHNKNIRIN